MRRGIADFLQIGIFGIQNAQRIGFQTTFAVFVQFVFITGQIFDQSRAVRRTLFAVAQAVDFQSQVIADTQLVPQIRRHRDDFRVDVRTFKTQSLDTDLMKLAVTSFLRTLAAEHRSHVPQLLRAVVQQIVFDHRTQAGCRTFRPQAQAQRIVGIGKSVHFLTDHIGFFADGTDKQTRLLDNRRTDLLITISTRPAADHIFKRLPKCSGQLEIFLFDGQKVVHAFDGLDFLCHFK